MADEQAFEPITTQEKLGSIIKERIERAKRSTVPDDYDELKAKAERLDDAETRAERPSRRRPGSGTRPSSTDGKLR